MGNTMSSDHDVLGMCSDWYEQLSRSPQLLFANLSSLRQQLAPAGAYVIWLLLKDAPERLCLKIGKAQRARGGLHSRLYDHWHSREKPNPNVLALHLKRDVELAERTGLDLTDRAQRRRLLEDCCTFQAQPFGVSITPRQVAILECFLTVRLLPRYVGPGEEYPPLPAGVGQLSGQQLVAAQETSRLDLGRTSGSS
jgi:hypothetical protein